MFWATHLVEFKKGRVSEIARSKSKASIKNNGYLYAFMGGQEEVRLDRVCDLGVNHSPWRDVSSLSYRILNVFRK